MEFGKDYKTQIDLQKMAENEVKESHCLFLAKQLDVETQEMWEGKEVLFLEWIKPLPSIGVKKYMPLARKPCKIFQIRFTAWIL